MKKILATIFGSLEPSYLVRQYLFGIVFYIIFMYSTFQHMTIPMGIFLTINLILYPFAMFVYDSIVGLILGDRIFLTSWIISLIWGVIKVILIFSLSIFIAPFGVLYLLIKARN